MPPRPVTVVKAAPPQRKDSKPKPQFHTPNPFTALANLDDEDAFPPLGSAATTTRSARSGSGTTTAGASDHSDIIGNAFMRGYSLPPANRPGGSASRTNVQGGARCMSMPLLTRTGGAGSGDVSLGCRRDSAYSTVSVLLERTREAHESHTDSRIEPRQVHPRPLTTLTRHRNDLFHFGIDIGTVAASTPTMLPSRSIIRSSATAASGGWESGTVGTMARGVEVGTSRARGPRR